MDKVIAQAIPALIVVGVIWLIIVSNKRINSALSSAAETLNFTFISSKNIFRKYNLPMIDITRKSIEETAASIVRIYDIQKNK